QKPEKACEKCQQRGIKQGWMSKFLRGVALANQQMRQHGQHHTDHQRNHPTGKVRPHDFYIRVAAAAGKKQCCNESESLHGRAPPAKLSAAALSAPCAFASTTASRACASCFS